LTVDVQAVVGDTILSSAAWITGAKGLTPKDVFDCCIVSFSLPPSSSLPARIIAIPAVRFIAGVSASSSQEFDVETNFPTRGAPDFIPKGSPNVNESTNSWWYYIPCEHGLWLSMKIDVPGGTIIGKQTAQIVNDAQITATLARGNLNISLAHVNEIKHTAELAQRARNVVVSLLAK
jgi:hypothetical protein